MLKNVEVKYRENKRSEEHGKMLVLMFNDNEEEMFNRIVSYVSADVIQFSVKDFTQKILRFAGLEIDINRRIVIKQTEEVKLTFLEFEILLLLAQNMGMIFSKEQIYDIVWKEPYFGDYNIVMSHIRNIREKIEDDPSKPAYIQTMWGVGYRFNATV